MRRFGEPEYTVYREDSLLDLKEAQRLAASHYISPESLLTLPEGHFYFLERMNPSPIPLLISFQIRGNSFVIICTKFNPA